LSLVACGGGGNEAELTGSEGSPPPASPAARAVKAKGDELIADRSPTEEADYAALAEKPEDLPDAIAKNVAQNEPTLVFFYDPSQGTSRLTRAEVDKALKTYRGLMALTAYDASRYVKTDPATGDVVVDDKLKSDKDAEKVAKLMGQLGVALTPFIVIVDDKGYVTWRGRGLQDQKVIEAEIARATK
jgi:hypothetical protein